MAVFPVVGKSARKSAYKRAIARTNARYPSLDLCFCFACSAVRFGGSQRQGGVDKAWEADGGISPGPDAEQDCHRRREVRLCG